ncbi:hypothetical protein PFISCL1PPCAC_17169 [Pristionchus fissidentatus]|uniref:protein-disulfide reductase n=1 Tax=Pristionchus fissidentatus TaxID=1538716 RepID=A0AAV5W719_9BILA|nr:hypothetical protein PFISCL1PPCAC_17169 [Pristionchus fissidentatus]
MGQNRYLQYPIMSEFLAGVELVLADESKVDAGAHLKDKLVALYFSASWCPPCRAFTPKLKRFYEEVKEAGKDFEVIFVSRDREDEALVEYYKEHMGAWAYIPFGNEKIQELLKHFEVKTIPSLKVIKPDGTILVQDARTEVQEKGVENAVELYEEWEAFYF